MKTARALSLASLAFLFACTAAPKKSVDQIMLFASDEACEKLVTSTIQSKITSASAALDFAATVLFPRMREAGLDVTGVSLKQDGNAAELSFSTSATTDRHLASLSSCERLSYIDALIATVQQRKEWQVETITITENGEVVEF